MKLEQLGKIVPRDEACVLLRHSTSVTNLALCSFLLASCLPSPNLKWHHGAKQNQQSKSEIKGFYQSDKGKQRLCSVTDRAVDCRSSGMGRSVRQGRQGRGGGEGRKKKQGMALQSFLLNLWFALDLHAHAELKEGCKIPGEGGAGFTQFHAAAGGAFQGEGDKPEDAAVIPMGPAITRPGTQPSRQVIHSGCVASSEAVRSVNTHGRARVPGRLISSSSVLVSSLSHAQCCCLSFTSFLAEQNQPSFFQACLSKGLLLHV